MNLGYRTRANTAKNNFFRWKGYKKLLKRGALNSVLLNINLTSRRECEWWPAEIQFPVTWKIVAWHRGLLEIFFRCRFCPNDKKNYRKWRPEEKGCNTMFVWTAGVGLGHRGNHIALALRTLPADPFPLPIMHICIAFFYLRESLGTLQEWLFNTFIV